MEILRKEREKKETCIFFSICVGENVELKFLADRGVNIGALAICKRRSSNDRPGYILYFTREPQPMLFAHNALRAKYADNTNPRIRLRIRG